MGVSSTTEKGNDMKKLMITAVLALTALALPATASAHKGPPVDVFTDTVKGSAVLPFAGPCGGGPGTVSVEFHDVFHVTAFADGHINVLANQTGTFEFEPDDPTEQSSSGRYRQAFREGVAPNGVQFHSTFTANGKFEDGSKLKFTVKSTFVVSNGEVRVDRFEVSC